jgi:hypothetical protein
LRQAVALDYQASNGYWSLIRGARQEPLLRITWDKMRLWLRILFDLALNKLRHSVNSIFKCRTGGR